MPSAHALLAQTRALGAALTDFELRVGLADDVDRALALDDLAIGVAILGGSQGGGDFHGGLDQKWLAVASRTSRGADA